MKIDKTTVKKIAHLARLKFDDSAEAQMVNDMNAILAFVEKLQEVDTSQVKPLESMSFEVNNLRADKSEKVLSQQEALQNAPSKDEKHFLVPKVLH